MEKLLIAVIDDDKIYANETAMYLKQQEYISDVITAYNGIDGFDLTTAMHPDVVILDSIMPDLDGIGYMMKLNKCDLNYKPKIILKCPVSTKRYIVKAHEQGAMVLMQDDDEPKKIYEKILKFFVKEEQNKKKRTADDPDFIAEVMISLGVFSHLLGYKYLSKALQYATADISVTYSITENLYSVIAKEFNVSSKSVTDSIRCAISKSWKRGDKKLLQSIFGMRVNEPKAPTNTEYIAMIADDLRIRLKYE